MCFVQDNLLEIEVLRMNKLILISGLMLFSFFFGAGNLIFPPMLGYTAQENMWVSMTGFAITGILLPYITVIVVAYMNGGVESIGNKVHPIFGTVLLSVFIYLSEHFMVFQGLLTLPMKSEPTMFCRYIIISL